MQNAECKLQNSEFRIQNGFHSELCILHSSLCISFSVRYPDVLHLNRLAEKLAALAFAVVVPIGR